MVTLRSSKNVIFKVDELVAAQSQTIKYMIEDNSADTVIPLPNVTGQILAKVIEYCKRHVDEPKSEDKAAEQELKSFDVEFIKVDRARCSILSWYTYNWGQGSIIMPRLLYFDWKGSYGNNLFVKKGQGYIEKQPSPNPHKERNIVYWEHPFKAANYLKIESLLDLTLQALADMIKGKNPDKIPIMFGMKTDFTPEEGEEVCRKNAWEFE